MTLCERVAFGARVGLFFRDFDLDFDCDLLMTDFCEFS